MPELPKPIRQFFTKKRKKPTPQPPDLIIEYEVDKHGKEIFRDKKRKKLRII